MMLSVLIMKRAKADIIKLTYQGQSLPIRYGNGNEVDIRFYQGFLRQKSAVVSFLLLLKGYAQPSSSLVCVNLQSSLA